MYMQQKEGKDRGNNIDDNYPLWWVTVEDLLQLEML